MPEWKAVGIARKFANLVITIIPIGGANGAVNVIFVARNCSNILIVQEIWHERKADPKIRGCLSIWTPLKIQISDT